MSEKKKPNKQWGRKGLVHPKNPYAKQFMVFDPKKCNTENPKFKKKSTTKSSEVSHYLQSGWKKNQVRLTCKTVWKSANTPNTSGDGEILLRTMIGDLTAMGYYRSMSGYADTREGRYHACRKIDRHQWWVDHLLFLAVKEHPDLRKIIEYDSENPHPKQDAEYWANMDRVVDAMLKEIKKYEAEGIAFRGTANPTAAAIGNHMEHYQRMYRKATGCFSTIEVEEADKVDWSRFRKIGQKTLFDYMM